MSQITDITKTVKASSDQVAKLAQAEKLLQEITKLGVREHTGYRLLRPLSGTRVKTRCKVNRRQVHHYREPYPNRIRTCKKEIRRA